MKSKTRNIVSILVFLIIMLLVVIFFLVKIELNQQANLDKTISDHVEGQLNSKDAEKYANKEQKQNVTLQAKINTMKEGQKTYDVIGGLPAYTKIINRSLIDTMNEFYTVNSKNDDTQKKLINYQQANVQEAFINEQKILKSLNGVNVENVQISYTVKDNELLAAVQVITNEQAQPQNKAVHLWLLKPDPKTGKIKDVIKLNTIKYKETKS